MGETSNANLLTTGSIPKKIIMFAIPLLWGNLFQQLYNVADSLIVGNFLGNNALAAVSSSGNLIFLMVGFFGGIGVGAGVVIARYFGAGEYEKLKKAIHTALAFGGVCGIFLTVAALILAPQILKLIGTPEEQRVADAWKAAMADVLKVKDQNQIPELNVYQCGTYTMHSLEEAQDIARHIIERDVRINSNDELALPKEKLQELHI